jgi:hypothetical protein
VRVLLGNTAPVEVLDRDTAKGRGHNLRELTVHSPAVAGDEDAPDVPARYRVPVELDSAEDERATVVTFPDETDLLEAFTNVTHPQGAWVHHSDSPPSWVSSDDDMLAQMLARQYGCPVHPWHEKKKLDPTVAADDEEADA